MRVKGTQTPVRRSSSPVDPAGKRAVCQSACQRRRRRIDERPTMRKSADIPIQGADAAFPRVARQPLLPPPPRLGAPASGNGDQPPSRRGPASDWAGSPPSGSSGPSGGGSRSGSPPWMPALGQLNPLAGSWTSVGSGSGKIAVQGFTAALGSGSQPSGHGSNGRIAIHARLSGSACREHHQDHGRQQDPNHF